MARRVLCHPTDKRALTPDEIAYVEQCSIAAMQGFVTRGAGFDAETISEMAWKQAFEMLKQRDRVKMFIG